LKDPNKKVPIWKTIKESIGKDLSRISVPVYFNEPLSMLQKLAEMMEYQNLIVQANNTEDPVLRLIYLATFKIAHYKCSLGRVRKPFNPILGETYELDQPDFRFFAEQVQHHPPVSASYAFNKNGDYQLWMNSFFKTAFWGSSMEVTPLGLTHVQLNKHNEEYVI